MIGRSCLLLAGSGAIVAGVDVALYEAFLQVVKLPDAPTPDFSLLLIVGVILAVAMTMGLIAGILVGLLNSACLAWALALVPGTRAEEKGRRHRVIRLVSIGSSIFLGWVFSNVLIAIGDFFADPGGYVRMQWKQQWVASGAVFDFLFVATNVIPVVIMGIGGWLTAEHIIRLLSEAEQSPSWERSFL